MLNINDEAVIGLPVYLLVAIIVGSIVFAAFALSVYNMHKDAQVGIVRAEIEKITAEAENMFEYADEGTLVTIHVDFPDSMSFVVFGSLPRDGTSKPSDLSLNEDMSNSYYFVMDDGTMKTFSSNARFSGESTDEIAVLFPGSYTLRLELLESGGKSYVKIY